LDILKKALRKACADLEEGKKPKDLNGRSYARYYVDWVMGTNKE
jgi:hypothetical protein